jgi:hypothetical protein
MLAAEGLLQTRWRLEGRTCGAQGRWATRSGWPPSCAHFSWEIPASASPASLLLPVGRFAEAAKAGKAAMAARRARTARAARAM